MFETSGVDGSGAIRLVRPNLALLDAALAGDRALAQALGHDVAPGWASFRQALQSARDALAADPGRAEWATRFFVTEDPPELVGWGGFKGPPRDGVVELGYEIAEGRRGRGLATAATRAMVAEAFADERVTAVIAHTLAEPNASNRVLENVGFRRDGMAEEQGQPVWRYSLTARDGTPSGGGD
jgi:ribosomal-protein-alanine N-acetyltransferase